MSPSLYEQCVGSLTSLKIYLCKICETGPTVYRPHPRGLDSLTTCSVITKAAHSLQLFIDPHCWSGWGLNRQPPSQQTDTALICTLTADNNASTLDFSFFSFITAFRWSLWTLFCSATDLFLKSKSFLFSGSICFRLKKHLVTAKKLDYS